MTGYVVPVSWSVCVLAWLLIVLVDVESVLFTGPALFLLGLVLLVIGALHRSFWFVALGIGHISIVVLFVALVIAYSWSPSDAKDPFAAMSLSYVLFVSPVSFVAWMRRPRGFAPWQCRSCGYALIGLRSGRCPECGTPFDDREVRRFDYARIDDSC